MTRSYFRIGVHVCTGMLVLAILLGLMITGSANAHRIYVDVNSQGVEIEAYYGDGKPVRNADVTVYRSNDEVYIIGKTDDDGKFSFEVTDPDPDSEYLTIVVEQLGHKAEVSIGTGVESDSGEEMPLYLRVIAGFGYLIGLAGIVSFYSAWKLNKRSKIKEKEKVKAEK